MTVIWWCFITRVHFHRTFHHVRRLFLPPRSRPLNSWTAASHQLQLGATVVTRITHGGPRRGARAAINPPTTEMEVSAFEAQVRHARHEISCCVISPERRNGSRCSQSEVIRGSLKPDSAICCRQQAKDR
jgi:hypothetical protein